MENFRNKIVFRRLTILLLIIMSGCKKENKDYPKTPDAVYIVADVATGPFPGASTTITNSATGNIKTSTVSAKVFVNTLKEYDVLVTYALSGTAVSGIHYIAPDSLNILIPAGQWFGRIQIPTISGILPSNKTLIITLISANSNMQLGIGTARGFKIFTYTLTN